MTSRDESGSTARKLSHASLALCILLFAIFVGNILLGKFKLAFGWPAVPIFSDLTEYLLLLATALSFAIAGLMSERAALEQGDGKLKAK